MNGTVRTVLAALCLPAFTSVALAQAPAAKPAAPAAPAAKPAAPGASAAAPPGAPMAPPKPAPEFAAFLKGAEGNWKCESTMPAGAMGPGSPEMKMKSTTKLKKVLDGFAYEGEWEMKQMKEMPKGRFVLAWDAAGKQIVGSNYDNMGNVSSTTGTVAGDSATLTGSATIMGQKMKIREVITVRNGGKEMTHSMETDTGKGWQPMGKDECKK